MPSSPPLLGAFATLALGIVAVVLVAIFSPANVVVVIGAVFTLTAAIPTLIKLVEVHHAINGLSAQNLNATDKAARQEGREIGTREDPQIPASVARATAEIKASGEAAKAERKATLDAAGVDAPPVTRDP